MTIGTCKENTQSATGMSPSPERHMFERDLIALMPDLTAYSRGLCGRTGMGDDIAQDALAKAWSARDSFAPGSNLKAWLFTITRHEFFSHTRRSWRGVQWNEELGDNIPAPGDEQMAALDLSDCVRGFDQLPQRQREALLLIGAGGYTYLEAADILGTAVGNIKSRTARGRARLSQYFDGEEAIKPRAMTPAGRGMDGIFVQVESLKAARASRPTLH
jgi:RNA polymerase sigma-70 factor, ECF subfamily